MSQNIVQFPLLLRCYSNLLVMLVLTSDHWRLVKSHGIYVLHVCLDVWISLARSEGTQITAKTSTLAVLSAEPR